MSSLYELSPQLSVRHFRAEQIEEVLKKSWNQRLLKHVWFMSHAKPIRNSFTTKSKATDEGSIHSGKIEESAEEKLNEFQILRTSPFQSLFTRKLR